MTIITASMASSITPLAPEAPASFGTLALAYADRENPSRAPFPWSAQDHADSKSERSERDPIPAPPSPIRSAADRFFTTITARSPYLRGTKPFLEHFRVDPLFVANVMLQAHPAGLSEQRSPE